MAVLVLVAFDCLLRAGEILALQKQHITFYKGKVGLSIWGKSAARFGEQEEVVSNDKLVFSLLKRLCDGKRMISFLFSGGDGNFRARWHWAISALSLDPAEWKPYALRRGGATHHWATHKDAPSLCVHDRWTHFRTAQLYAVEGHEMLKATQIGKEASEKIAWWGSYFKKAVPLD